MTTWRKPAFAIFGTLAQKTNTTIISPLRPSLSFFYVSLLSKRFLPFLRCSTLALSLANLSMTLIPCTSAWRFGPAKGSALTSFFPGGLGLGCSKWVWDPLSNLGHRGFLELSFSDPISTAFSFQQNRGDLSLFSPPTTMVLIRSTGKFNMESSNSTPQTETKNSSTQPSVDHFYLHQFVLL